MPVSVRMRSRFSAGASAVIATAPPPITGWPFSVVSRLKRSVASGSVSTRRLQQVAPAEHEEDDDAEQRC